MSESMSRPFPRYLAADAAGGRLLIADRHGRRALTAFVSEALARRDLDLAPPPVPGARLAVRDARTRPFLLRVLRLYREQHGCELLGVVTDIRDDRPVLASVPIDRVLRLGWRTAAAT